jgi:type I restriction enzyme S subunit
LTKDSIAGFPVLLPPLDLIRRYGQIASAFHTQREKLSQRITNLRTTRDLLLPKLVSGEVSVANLEQEALAETV